MFDKFSDAAEKLATSVSRRSFLGSLGRWGGAAALGVAGLLVSGKEARAGGVMCYGYYNSSTGQTCSQCPPGGPPPAGSGWHLVASEPKGSCAWCHKKYGDWCPF
jgi:hypothetical protein